MRLFWLVLVLLSCSPSLFAQNVDAEASTELEVPTRVALHEVTDQLVFHDEWNWSGSVKITGELPSTAEGVDVVLEVIFPGDRELFVRPDFGFGTVLVVDRESKTSYDGSHLFRFVSSTKLSPAGTFAFPLIESAPPKSLFRIRPRGEFLVSEGRFFTLEQRDAPSSRRKVDLFAVVGYRAELRFHLPDDATEAERAALVGRTLSFRGEAQGRMASAQYEPALEMEAKVLRRGEALIARLEEIGLQPLHYQQPRDTTRAEDCLAPFYVSEIATIEPAPGEDVIVDVELERGITLAGGVKDQRGRAIDGAAVSISCIRSREARPYSLDFLNQTIGVVTDADGSFVARAVPADFKALKISVPNKRHLEASAAETLALGRDDLRFIIEDGQTLFGRVVLANGRPLAETAVKFEIPEGSSRWGSRGAVTDVEGRFRIDGILDDEITMSVDGWRSGGAPVLLPKGKKSGDATRWLGMDSARASATSEQEPFDLIVRPARAIRGRVRLDGLGSFDDCYVWVGGDSLVQNKDRFLERDSNYRAKRFPIDPNTGAFEVTEFSMGPVGVFAQVGLGKRSRSSQLFTTHATELQSSIELKFQPDPEVVGTVVDREGRPVQGATVRVSRVSRWSVKPWKAADSDDMGRFTLGHMIPGEYEAYLEHPSQLLPSPVTFVIGESAAEGASGREPLVLSTVRGGSVDVHWDLAGGARLKEHGLPFLTDTSGRRVAMRPRPWQSYSEPSTSLGPFLPGEYFACMTFHHGGQGGPVTVMRRAVTVRAEQVAEVHLQAQQLITRVVHGRATDEAGAPLRGYRVRIERAGKLIASCQTGAEGRFSAPFEGDLGNESIDRTHEVTVAELIEPTSGWVVANSNLPDLPAGPTTINWVLPLGSIKGRMSGGEEQRHLFMGSVLEITPTGFALEERVPRRGPVRTQQVFEIPHLAPGTYTLTVWRRAPGEGGRLDFYSHSEQATERLEVTVGPGNAAVEVELTLIER